MKSRRCRGYALTLLLLTALSSVVTGCQSKEVVSGVDRKQAADLIIALNESGIPAQDSKSGSGAQSKFTVTVSSGRYVDALRIARELGIGSKDESALQELLGSKSFVPPTPQMAASRADFLRALEIERFLEVIPAIGSARAIVSSQDGKSPAITVAVRLRAVEDGVTLPADIRKALSQVVENPDEVQILITKSGIKPGTHAASVKSFGDLGFDLIAQPGMFQLSSLLLLAGMSALIVGLVIGSRLAARGLRRSRPRRGTYPELRTGDATAPRLAAQRGNGNDARRDAV